MVNHRRTTFQKRLKEMARKERQQRKADRRQQRKLARTATERIPEYVASSLEVGAKANSKELSRGPHQGS